MTWQQRLQPASFRGVSFHIDTATGQEAAGLQCTSI